MFMVLSNGVNVYQGTSEKAAYSMLAKFTGVAVVEIFKYDGKEKQLIPVIKVS